MRIAGYILTTLVALFLTFDTILKVIGALGLKLHAEATSSRLRDSRARSRGRMSKRRAA